MDQATCYTLIALLTGACGALMLLWYRAANRVTGEYRMVTPLPPPGALAEDLHDAFRRGCPMVGGAVLADDLPGCSETWREGIRAQVAHLYRALGGEAPRPPTKLPSGVTHYGPPVRLPIVALFALGLVCCASQMTRDRQQLTPILQAKRAAVVRLQSGDAACQSKIVKASKTKEEAIRSLAAYRDRRAAAEQMVTTVEAAADEAQNQLLLSDPAAAQTALLKAREAAAQLRAKVQQLMEGC